MRTHATAVPGDASGASPRAHARALDASIAVVERSSVAELMCTIPCAAFALACGGSAASAAAAAAAAASAVAAHDADAATRVDRRVVLAAGLVRAPRVALARDAAVQRAAARATTQERLLSLPWLATRVAQQRHWGEDC